LTRTEGRTQQRKGMKQKTEDKYVKACVSRNLLENKLIFVGLEVLISVVMKSSVFWDVTPCNPLKAN
jgi:hypothetical protein